MFRRLTSKEEYRIKKSVEDGIMTFSPTISPAPKCLASKEIESLSQAILYYYSADAGIKKVIIQKKHMGSYCDIYLNKDINKTKFFSRKGYPVHLDRNELLAAVQSLYNKLDWSKAKMYIIQSELMPWSALGEQLIDREFYGYARCHQTHANYINENNLSEITENLKTTEYKQYCTDKVELAPSALKNKYPDHIVKQYEALTDIAIPNISIYTDAINLYKQQVDLYSIKQSLYFKPFNILKIIYDDDSEELPNSNITNYQIVSDEKYLVIDFEKDLTEQIASAYEFYNSLIKENYEGVMVKPDNVWSDVVPMFKVRNNNYLQMIYGVNFQSNFEYYLERRRVKKKIDCSINEWNIAKALLKIPANQITINNPEYVELVTKRILEEDFEAKLDSRL